MARLTDPEKRDRQQKELVRKRGGSLMRKAEQLGRLGEIFVFTVFYDPLYGYDGIVNIPEGFEEPNIKKMNGDSTKCCATVTDLPEEQDGAVHIHRHSGRKSPKNSPKRLCWMRSQSSQVTEAACTRTTATPQQGKLATRRPMSHRHT
ncbi:hypothetical protein PoMZ_13713 [Pyricularia oryzae]|uniref:Uncharacterized protein n=1 Tax=Pyricularia oryzae TaxID=318829 RepID=A0A4V1C8F7_PYROR|nr:hypothetical protein PoMZ_13713 [Pyricularia oryzae]